MVEPRRIECRYALGGKSDAGGDQVGVEPRLARGPDKIGQAAEDLNAVVADVGSFAAEHREAIGTASDKLASITTALVDSLDDIKQTLHISPTVLQNFNNIFEPANGALTGALAGNNMANPIAFLCGAIHPTRGGQSR